MGGDPRTTRATRGKASYPAPLMAASVSIVLLVHNRCEKLRTTLERMLFESDYPADRVEVIVVDNASTDGSADMVRSRFPGVRLVERSENIGVSAWNDG